MISQYCSTTYWCKGLSMWLCFDVDADIKCKYVLCHLHFSIYNQAHISTNGPSGFQGFWRSVEIVEQIDFVWTMMNKWTLWWQFNAVSGLMWIIWLFIARLKGQNILRRNVEFPSANTNCPSRPNWIFFFVKRLSRHRMSFFRNYNMSFDTQIISFA